MSPALLLAVMLLAADESAADQERRDEVAQLAPAKARMLELSIGEERPAQASLIEKPLLRWSNPTAGSVYGEVYLWHFEGRPTAIASIFRWYHPFKDGTVEITSLSTQPVAAREEGKVQWDCRSPGVTFQDLSEAEAPASSAGVRLTQMRALARRFSAELEDTRSGERIERQLRLLNSPLHRYSSPRQGVIDGTLFALAEVTDPEVIVMIEAFKERDASRWRYALARMNNHELEVRLDDKVVQSWPRIDAPWKDRRSSYTLFSFDPQLVKTDQRPPSP